MTIDARNSHEIKRSFDSFESWRGFLEENPRVVDPNHIQDIVDHALANGIYSQSLGVISQMEIDVLGRNFREDFHARGFNSRQRTIMDLAFELLEGLNTPDVRIYAHEALTNFALFFRGRFPRFIGSEYGVNEREVSALFPIPSIDIQRSPFADEMFDLILSGDVFEHVPNLPAVLTDSYRILKPGGCLLASFPFNYGSEEMMTKATVGPDGINYLCEPEYHGNPANPGEGSLVFQIPGWSILEIVRQSGFAHAEMIFWSSQTRGFVSAELAGNFVLRAQR